MIVAPLESHSGGGHRLTTHSPIRVSRRDEFCFAIDGTPADSVRLALDRLVPDVDWVLSGINHGANLGADLYLSGTAAVVREGVLHGKPGVAVSHYHRTGIDPRDWQRATRWLIPILRDLVQRAWTPGTFWNVNMPYLPPDAPDPEVVFCPVDPSPLPLSYEVNGELHTYNTVYHQRPRQPGSDIETCFNGSIAVSQVRVF